MQKNLCFRWKMEFFTIKYSRKTENRKFIRYIEYKLNKYNIHIDKFKRYRYNNW